MRFVRVLMKIGQIGPTFSVPWKIVNLFWVKTVVPSSTLKMRKNYEKIGTCIRIYTLVVKLSVGIIAN